MTSQDNIWHRLRDYELTPPPEVTARVHELLNKERQGAAAAEPGSLDRLGSHEVQPPAALRSSIEDIIKNSAPVLPAPPRRQGKTFSLYAYRAVAACLLVAVATWGIYRISIKSSSLPLASGSKPAVSDSNHTAAPPAAHATDTSSLASAQSETPAKQVKNLPPHLSLRVDGQSFVIADNDLFVTFTRFDYNKLPEFLADNITHELKVHLDQYANLIISQPMAGMLKEMYRLKSNGNPTRRARKRRERLEKWKKTDETYFDQSTQKNPLDPIDLGGFIFK